MRITCTCGSYPIATVSSGQMVEQNNSNLVPAIKAIFAIRDGCPTSMVYSMIEELH